MTAGPDMSTPKLVFCFSLTTLSGLIGKPSQYLQDQRLVSDVSQACRENLLIATWVFAISANTGASQAHDLLPRKAGPASEKDDPFRVRQTRAISHRL